MKEEELSKILIEFKSIFPECFIYKESELIVEPKNNVYFRVDNINSKIEFDCKVLEYISRYAHKHPTLYWRKWFKRGFNSYFRFNFTDNQLGVIYRRLGNGVNRKLAIEFIESGFNVSKLY